MPVLMTGYILRTYASLSSNSLTYITTAPWGLITNLHGPCIVQRRSTYMLNAHENHELLEQTIPNYHLLVIFILDLTKTM